MIPIARPLIGTEEREAVDRVLRSGLLTQGAEVAAFEDEFSALVAGRRCVAVNSGTSALHLGLLAAGVAPGDEVIVPSFTFAATANAVRLCGAVPVFVDIEPAAFGVDAAAVSAAITARTVAVVAVALFGQPPQMADLAEICATHGLLLIEDAAQAHGSSFDGRPVGAWGDVAAFSFYPTKNMTTGEGGMIAFADPAFERAARLLRNQGMERRYYNEVVGFNLRMTETAAAMGRVQLTKLGAWNQARQRNAARYDAHLQDVVAPQVSPRATHVYHQYTVRAAERDNLVDHLTRAGVGTGIYYPVPVHRLPSFGLKLSLPVTDRACNEVVSLPVGPHLDASQVDAVVAAVNCYAEGHRSEGCAS